MKARAAAFRLFVLAALITSGGCASEGPSKRAVPSYDSFTRRLLQLSADQTGDGRIDQWTYLDGNRPIRGEADTDGDGRIDRWEYFGSEGALTMVGSSSLNDGLEDTWTMTQPNSAGERLVSRSIRRDHIPDRYEYSNATTLIRVEEDTNGDGMIDKWERYDGPILREVAFDVSFSKGRPDRRALYDEHGRFTGVEVDPDGDGVFVPAPDQAENPKVPGAS